MTELPPDWVDRLCSRFAEIYGEPITTIMDNPINCMILKTMIQNGLSQLTNAEIKRGLYICRMYNQNPMPSIVEFFHWSRGIKYTRPGRKQC